MRIDPVSFARVGNIGGIDRAVGAQAGGNANGEKVDFGKAISSALQQLNDVKGHADEMTARLISGEVTDIHQVVLAVEKANLAVQFATQVRNKALESYQEIMRMNL